jgi:hypothetical protein
MESYPKFHNEVGVPTAGWLLNFISIVVFGGAPIWIFDVNETTLIE